MVRYFVCSFVCLLVCTLACWLGGRLVDFADLICKGGWLVSLLVLVVESFCSDSVLAKRCNSIAIDWLVLIG